VVRSSAASDVYKRQTIANYTADRYKETKITSGWWQGIVQSFTSLPLS
jgi:hypothetical protein